MISRHPAHAALFVLLLAAPVAAQQTSENNAQLKQALERFPEADADRDGVLTRAEARAYLSKIREGNLPRRDVEEAVRETDAFKTTAAELDALMKADNVAAQQGPLQFEKGNGLRILMTGHSWVAPGRISLPLIARGAGLDGHHQRSHTGGGATGSARSIWLAEIGKYDGQPPRPILLPAIATGQWDVMTWGAFYGDTVEDFSRWIDVCLKANPAMVFYIQDGWPTYSRALEPAEALETFNARKAEIRQYMGDIFGALDAKYPGKVHVIPAGDAVVAILHLYLDKKLPGFDCVSEHLGGTNGIYRDGGHLSTKSGMGHLVGYLYYGTLYGKSPERIEGIVPGAKLRT